MKYGLIAGNGRFPILALEEARKLGHQAIAFGIREEASKEIEALASKTHWISIGQLGRLIDLLKEEGVTELIMTGQVKHVQIFSGIQPDWRLAKLLFRLAAKNTDSLIGGVVEELEKEGIHLRDSTFLLKPLLAAEGVMSRRKPSREEETDIAYGRRVANALSAFDVGQSVAIAERACLAVEAMEGTDEMLRRAAGLANGRPIRLVKASRRRQHMLFDVPVAGPRTIEVMRETGATALAVDAGRTLLIDREEMLAAANAAGIAIAGYKPEEESKS
ncbi:MAG: UDP-2,3-diacylglucosamine diphosphatase LpxI [Bryobacteraceae bacterium]|nr:UDP-2,3-diacylglucosamine diphosphatase LpxI [Bryobacteraceae bacterium]